MLSNHDNARHRTRYGSEDRARAALFLLLGLRGSPVLYAGEELGLEDAVVPPDRVVDPGGRDGCRAPLPWTGAPDHGWGVDRRLAAVAARRRHPQRRGAAGRRRLHRPPLPAAAGRHGGPRRRYGSATYEPVEAPGDVIAWRRTADPAGAHGPGDRVVAVNMGPEPAMVDLTGTVVVASDGAGEGEPFTGALGPDSAVLLHPSG